MKTRDMSLREFNAALAKFGFSSDDAGMQYVTHDGDIKRVAYATNDKGKVSRRASLKKLWVTINHDTDMESEAAE